MVGESPNGNFLCTPRLELETSLKRYRAAYHSYQPPLVVYFLTEGGTELYYDVRRNSLDEAVKLCLENGLQGIVSEVEAIFRNPTAITKIKDSKLTLLTYGKLNKVSEAVYMQYLMGIDGVIVDFVEEITEAVSNTIKRSKDDDGDEEGLAEGGGEDAG